MQRSRRTVWFAASAGPIAIVEGRHPVLEALSERPFQPNDTFMADTSSFHVIGGPNMAGKSTYLRQVYVRWPSSDISTGQLRPLHGTRAHGMPRGCRGCR